MVLDMATDTGKAFYHRSKRTILTMHSIRLIVLSTALLLLMKCTNNNHHRLAAVALSTTPTVTRTALTPPSSLRSQQTNERSHPIKIPWLIVGGGIHGVHIATRLLGQGHLNHSQIRIIDENESLLLKWKSRTAATGMEYLRSSAGYHLDLDEQSLRRQFGRFQFSSSSRKKKKRGAVGVKTGDDDVMAFSNDYERPRLDVFNKHCDSVVEKYQLDELHIQGLVTNMEPTDDYVTVEILLHDDDDDRNENVYYNAQNVILALGNDEPSYPDWVADDDIQKGTIEHLLDQKHDKLTPIKKTSSCDKNSNVTSIAVIGGGITAAHKVLELLRTTTTPKSKNGINIHLISRHPLKEQQFDTHQDWMMDRAASKRSLDAGGNGTPECQKTFSMLSSWKERRLVIGKERIPGTVTPAIRRGREGLCYCIERGDVRWHQAEVSKKRYFTTNRDNRDVDGDDDADDDAATTRMELILSCGGTIAVDKVYLATGFGKKRPGGRLVRNLVDDAGLAVSDFCGFPIVDETLKWHPRLYVVGALAELELGPSARNIAGARLAAERILDGLRRNAAKI